MLLQASLFSRTLGVAARSPDAHRARLAEENKSLIDEKDKAVSEASEAQEKAERAQLRLTVEESKVTEMARQKRELEVSTNTLLAEKESIIVGLRNELSDARKDAAEADYTCRAWKVAKEMYENLAANLYALATPTLPADAEEKFRSWLESTGLSIDEPKEVVFISPDDFVSEGEGSRPAGTPMTETGEAEGSVLAEGVQDAAVNVSPKA